LCIEREREREREREKLGFGYGERGKYRERGMIVGLGVIERMVG
jgi:hypothetical protein